MMKKRTNLRYTSLNKGVSENGHRYYTPKKIIVNRGMNWIQHWQFEQNKVLWGYYGKNKKEIRTLCQ